MTVTLLPALQFRHINWCDGDFPTAECYGFFLFITLRALEYFLLSRVRLPFRDNKPYKTPKVKATGTRI
jgi:hypothetical protein